MRDIGQQLCATLMPSTSPVAGCATANATAPRFADHRVIQQRRLVKPVPPWTHLVSDRHQLRTQVNSVLGQHLECAMQRLGVIGNRG